MPNKAYAILLDIEDEDNGYLYFPIKRDDARDHPGMPQFFGGTKEGNETDWETIAREMNEESDGKIQLLKGGLVLIHTRNFRNSVYNFYVAKNYSGMHFLGDLKNNEMAKIAKLLVQIGGGDGVDEMLEKLQNASNIKFYKSETYTAFDKAIKWSETL